MRRALIALLPLTLAACLDDGSDIPHGTYRLTGMPGGPPPAATLVFEDDSTISGEAPCNLYHGQLQAPWPAFRPGPIAVTRRACPDLEAESRYFAALGAMTQGTLDGATLTLTGGGQTLRFTHSD